MKKGLNIFVPSPSGPGKPKTKSKRHYEADKQWLVIFCTIAALVWYALGDYAWGVVVVIGTALYIRRITKKSVVNKVETERTDPRPKPTSKRAN